MEFPKKIAFYVEYFQSPFLFLVNRPKEKKISIDKLCEFIRKCEKKLKKSCIHMCDVAKLISFISLRDTVCNCNHHSTKIGSPREILETLLDLAIKQKKFVDEQTENISKYLGNNIQEKNKVLAMGFYSDGMFYLDFILGGMVVNLNCGDIYSEINKSLNISFGDSNLYLEMLSNNDIYSKLYNFFTETISKDQIHEYIYFITKILYFSEEVVKKETERPEMQKNIYCRKEVFEEMYGNVFQKE